MGRLQRTKASLRISGDELVPSEITRLLRCAPTYAYAKGDEIVGKKTGRKRIARFGMWLRATTACEPGNLDAQIGALLAEMTDDLNVWEAITASCKVDMFCGLFMGRWNDGESLSAATLFALGSRHIELGLDIYGPDDNDPGG